MPSFITPSNGDDALAEHIAQLTENFSGLRNIPLSLTGINDASAYALTIKNAGTGSKGLIIYAADGSTVLLQVDSTGVKASGAGGAAAAVATQAGTETLTNKTLTSPVLNSATVNAANPPAANQLSTYSLAKGWALVQVVAGTPSLLLSYNVTSITDNGVGDLTVTWNFDLTTAGPVLVTVQDYIGTIQAVPGTGSVRVRCADYAGVLTDPAHYCIVAFGAA